MSQQHLAPAHKENPGTLGSKGKFLQDPQGILNHLTQLQIYALLKDSTSCLSKKYTIFFDYVDLCPKLSLILPKKSQKIKHYNLPSK